jgi:quercetin dioxygenase-like cupin family protein
MIVIRESDLQNIETPGGTISAGIATAGRGARQVSVIRQRQQAGGGNPPHTHDCEEVTLVTEGSLEVRIGEDVVTLNAGDSLVIPANTEHRLENAGTTDAAWLLIAPAGVGFFHASGEQADPVWAR